MKRVIPTTAIVVFGLSAFGCTQTSERSPGANQSAPAEAALMSREECDALKALATAHAEAGDFGRALRSAREMDCLWRRDMAFRKIALEAGRVCNFDVVEAAINEIGIEDFREGAINAYETDVKLCSRN